MANGKRSKTSQTSTPSTSSKDYPELHVDSDLLGKIREIIERRDRVEGLIAKAGETKESVKEHIVSRVLADYQKRLTSILAEFEPVRGNVCAVLTTIAARKVELDGELHSLSDDIEEQRFRCEVGEFSKKELDTLINEKELLRDTIDLQVNLIADTFTEAKDLVGEEAFVVATTGEALPVVKAAADALPAVPVEGFHPTAELDPSVVEEMAALATPPPPPADALIEKPASVDAKKVEAALAEATLSKGEEVTLAEGKKEEVIAAPAAPEAKELEAVAPIAAVESKLEHTANGPKLRITHKGGEVQTIELGAKALTIGRSPKNDIVVKAATVSRSHATLAPLATGGWNIVAARGKGLKLNGDKISQAELAFGDTIAIGPATLEVLER